ncbi:MAG: AAA family ATPase, partial [Candidatus Baldrarchaeia archaeon]
MNFDDIRLSSKPLDEIYKEYIERMLPQKLYIFLDEIHNAVNWTNLVRRLIDQRKANIHITDSSSYFIPVEYARILTGRKITL